MGLAPGLLGKVGGEDFGPEGGVVGGETSVEALLQTQVAYR